MQHTTTAFNEGGASNYKLARMMWPEEETTALLRLAPTTRAETIAAMTNTLRSQSFTVMTGQEMATMVSGMAQRERMATLGMMTVEQRRKLEAVEAGAV